MRMNTIYSKRFTYKSEEDDYSQSTETTKKDVKSAPSSFLRELKERTVNQYTISIYQSEIHI